jgi:hypothetical protein
LVKVCLWHLLEQGILDLRHEHHIALHFPAHLYVDDALLKQMPQTNFDQML